MVQAFSSSARGVSCKVSRPYPTPRRTYSSEETRLHAATASRPVSRTEVMGIGCCSGMLPMAWHRGGGPHGAVAVQYHFSAFPVLERAIPCEPARHPPLCLRETDAPHWEGIHSVDPTGYVCPAALGSPAQGSCGVRVTLCLRGLVPWLRAASSHWSMDGISGPLQLADGVAVVVRGYQMAVEGTQMWLEGSGGEGRAAEGRGGEGRGGEGRGGEGRGGEGRGEAVYQSMRDPGACLQVPPPIPGSREHNIAMLPLSTKTEAWRGIRAAATWSMELARRQPRRLWCRRLRYNRGHRYTRPALGLACRGAPACRTVEGVGRGVLTGPASEGPPEMIATTQSSF